MSRKAFELQVELDIQAVTCPGVWLCSNGKVSLQIYMLDSCIQTGSYKPHFPLRFDEIFTFSKAFLTKHRLNDLQKDLKNEWIYVELIQWQCCETGNVLATFQTTLDELLFPSTLRGSIAGVNVDLLMEPTQSFSGTIAPKIELNTRTTIEETVCEQESVNTSSTIVVNPKVLISTDSKRKKPNICRRVCHSIAFSRRKRPSFNGNRTMRPLFAYRKAEDDLILRKPQSHTLTQNNICSCRRSRSLERIPLKPSRRNHKLRPRLHQCPIEGGMCSCGSGHKENLCPVCAKYRGYFDNAKSSSPATPKKANSPVKNSVIRTNLFQQTSPMNNPQVISNNHRNCCSSCTGSFLNSNENDKDCSCRSGRKVSLAEKLHTRLSKTLDKTSEWICGIDDERTECCPCCQMSLPPPKHRSRAEFYHDLQKFYGNLYEKTRLNVAQASCVPDCHKHNA